MIPELEDTNVEPYAKDRNTRNSRGGSKVYDKKELEALISALSRIGIDEMANAPRELGRRYMPTNYILPMYPPNTMPEDVSYSF